MYLRSFLHVSFFIRRYFIACLASCNYVAVCQPLLKSCSIWLDWLVCVWHTDEPCRSGCTDRDAVWKADSCGPQEACNVNVNVEFKVTLHTNKSVAGAPYSIKSYSLSHSWTLWWRVRWLKHAVPSWDRGGTAAAMTAQNEQTTEEHSKLEQQSPGRLDHPAWCVVWTVWPAST